jgi:hypothetical protein
MNKNKIIQQENKQRFAGYLLCDKQKKPPGIM